ncbi:retinaldehyde-binding protein 1-like [Culex pipiens pallens]|uniref:retinaldehyde-binding protein 1-like n=1 Tax=Culex pipiens pallens TaxID=42434 RepID=UPI001954C416|nr:retinaldehyde-binding protein 1-like [Culex pipiens pallens]
MSTYKFTLSEQFRTLAKEELREADDAVRLDAINQLRDWIVKNPAIKHCRTDDVFLLKFLRFRKFAVHQAGESIERYLAARQKMPQWFQGTDPNADPLASIMDDCPITVLGRDDAGRTVIFIRVASYDAETLTQDSIMRYVMMMLDTLTEQEEVQIGGVRIWMDCTGISMKFVSLFHLSEYATMIDLMTKTMPIRIRQIHSVKLPKFAVSLANFALTFTSQKLKERIVCHHTTLDARAQMPEPLWPESFGGTALNVDTLNRKMRKQLEGKREWLLSLDEQLQIDTSRSAALWNKSETDAGGAPPEIESGMVGSFRKLNVD